MGLAACRVDETEASIAYSKAVYTQLCNQDGRISEEISGMYESGDTIESTLVLCVIPDTDL